MPCYQNKDEESTRKVGLLKIEQVSHFMQQNLCIVSLTANVALSFFPRFALSTSISEI